MKIQNLLTGLALLLLTACHGPVKYTGPTLFIGDSLTKNWHVEWIVPDAVSTTVQGPHIDQLHSEGLAKIQALKPGMVHIMVGTNERLLRDNFKVVGKVMSLAFAARRAGAVVIIGTIPPADAEKFKHNTLFDNSRYNNMLQIVGRLCGFRIADYNTALAGYDGSPLPYTLSDGVHPNEAGYTIMRRVLMETMQ